MTMVRPLLLVLTALAGLSRAEPPTVPRSLSLRWLSMYTSPYHCQWGCANATAATRNYHGCQPATNNGVDGRPSSSSAARGAAAPAAPADSGWTHLPRIQGDCLSDGVEWPATAGVTPNGCWLDQLATARRHNASGTMLMLQTSDYPGPLFCGHSQLTGDATHLCPDDCDDPGLPPPLRAVFLPGLRSPGVGSCGLAWLRKTLAFVRPLVAAGHIGGFMLGDELSDAMAPGNLSAVGDTIHQLLDPLPHFVYTNEGTHVFANTGWGPANKVPAGIDILSIDGYEYGANESLWHRRFYEETVFPALRLHQRVAVVPGLFGCDVSAGGCATDPKQAQRRCLCALSGRDLSRAGQAAGLVAKLEGFFAWAKDEPRIVGINPWHYTNRWPPTKAFPEYHAGAAAFPTLVAAMVRLGWRNVSQLRPPGACGPVVAATVVAAPLKHDDVLASPVRSAAGSPRESV